MSIGTANIPPRPQPPLPSPIPRLSLINGTPDGRLICPAQPSLVPPDRRPPNRPRSLTIKYARRRVAPPKPQARHHTKIRNSTHAHVAPTKRKKAPSTRKIKNVWPLWPSWPSYPKTPTKPPIFQPVQDGQQQIPWPSCPSPQCPLCPRTVDCAVFLAIPC